MSEEYPGMDETDLSDHNPLCHCKSKQFHPEFPEVARCWRGAEPALGTWTKESRIIPPCFICHTQLILLFMEKGHNLDVIYVTSALVCNCRVLLIFHLQLVFNYGGPAPSLLAAVMERRRVGSRLCDLAWVSSKETPRRKLTGEQPFPPGSTKGTRWTCLRMRFKWKNTK